MRTKQWSCFWHPQISSESEYAYALLIEQDKAKAEKIRNKFEKIKSTYPYKADVESEYELIKIADEKVNFES